MRPIVVAVVMAWGLFASPAAYSDSGEDLAKSSGCLGCHAIDTKKVGPAYKDVAKKFKGKTPADAAAAMRAASVHASVKVSDKDLKEILEWVLKL
jgi:cytochrome c